MSLVGEVRVVADPPAAYGEVVRDALAGCLGAAADAGPGAPGRRFRLGVSGSGSGEACMRALLAADLDWGSVEIFFADERCVPLEDPRSNAGSLAGVLGGTVGELAGWHPMDCGAGPRSYEELLRGAGGLDVLQLGFGPDGHTASLFPGSAALEAAPGALVVLNNDPTGANPLERMTLTFEGIATASTVVVVVTGASKREALARAASGEPLPATLARPRQGGRLLWLIDEEAAAGLDGLDGLEGS